MAPPAKPQIEHSIAKKNKDALILDVAQSSGQFVSPNAEFPNFNKL
jgi:hypothetical protein